MSIFSLLDNESEIQIYDKLRLNASKSFSSKAVAEITSLTIAPDIGTTAVSCFSSDLNERYLDWVYEDVTIDVGTENDDLIFSEQGGSDLSTSLTAGNYSLSAYATHVASKMTTAGTQTYTASVANNKITISAAASFQFKASSVATQSFFDIDEASASHTSDTVEYGNKIVTVVVGNGTETDTKYFYLKCYSVDGDKLFSSDGDLVAHEPDLMQWCPDGKSSFKNVYRRAQKLIIAWLDQNGYVNAYGDKFDKNDIIDIEEVRQWSTFMSLRLIFQGMSNAIDDVFDRKSKMYELNEEAARQRAILRIDTNNDGVADQSEGLSIYSGSLYRR